MWPALSPPWPPGVSRRGGRTCTINEGLATFNVLAALVTGGSVLLTRVKADYSPGRCATINEGDLHVAVGVEGTFNPCVCVFVCVCVCVCVRACVRARARVCVCLCDNNKTIL